MCSQITSSSAAIFLYVELQIVVGMGGIDQSHDLMSTFKISSLTNTQQGFSNITSGFEKARTAFNSTSILKVSWIIFLIVNHRNVMVQKPTLDAYDI